MVKIRRKLDSDTLHLPEIKPLIGRTVEITVEEQPPEVRDEFYAELGRTPQTVEEFEAQKAIFRNWRDDPRFEPYWGVLDHALVRTFEHVQERAAIRALFPLDAYDYDAVRDMDAREVEEAR